MKKLLFLISLLFGFYCANAQNITVTEDIDENDSWSADTVFVDADITILDSMTLTIDPGVVVVFNDFYGITVKGTLLSVGTPADTIKFTVTDTSGYSTFSHTGWNGIDFDNDDGSMDDNDTSRIAYSAFYFGKETDNWDGAGAIRIISFSNLVIQHSLFQHNYTSETGGAIGIENECEPVISRCTFLDNIAEYGGGAINVGCSNDVFFQPVITHCYFNGNKSLYDADSYYGGGALKLSGYNNALVINNTFENNESLSQGGALISSGYGDPYVVNNLFTGNLAEHNGGAIGIKYYAGGYFLNNTILDNTSNTYGGAVSIGCDNDSVFFMNNIIGENVCDSTEFNQFYIADADTFMFFYNNNIQGGLGLYDTLMNCTDNMDEDPLMIDPEGNDFRLSCASPCKDAGKDTMDYFPELDLSGVTRLTGESYDMGAYEVQEVTELNLGEDQTITNVENTILDAGEGYSSYDWTTDETTQRITVDGATVGLGEHTIGVTVTNEYLCEGSDEVVITVEEHIVGLDNNELPDISVYPNPSSGIITIEAKNSMVHITDLNGRLIGSYTLNDMISVDLSGYGKGLYLLEITSDEHTSVRRVIVK